MADKIEIGNICKFDGSNYRQWRFQIKCALKAKGVFTYTDGKVPRPGEEKVKELQEWYKKDAVAMFTLTSSMELSQITLVENCETSNEMLTKLDTVFDQKSELNKMLVHERFYQYKMTTNDSVAQHVSKVENLAKQIKESGDTISDAAIITKILNTLPLKFRTVRQAWLSVDEAKQTVTNLTARLLDEEASLNVYEEETALAMTLNSKTHVAKKKNSKDLSRISCFNCKKKGHYANKCPEEKKKKTTGDKTFNDSENDTAFNVNSENFCYDDSWIMDSGASAHVSYRRDFFFELDETKSGTVSLGNNQILTVNGKGTIKIQKFVDDCWTEGTINNVLYVPDLRKNLFSEGVITSTRNMTIVKEGKMAKVFLNGKAVASAIREQNNLYKMQFRTMICSLNTIKTNSLQQWHERLGHLNIKSIKEMCSKGLVNGVECKDFDTFFCATCAFGKQYKAPFKKKEHVKAGLGERIYSDLCGPMSEPSVQGSKYFILFKDDFSGFRVGYFIKNKSDAFECFKLFASKIKNKFGTQIKYLHVDNGGEYCNLDFKQFLNKNGIELETTAPYTPEQNARAERENRTVMECARSMMCGAGVPKYLWAEAVNTAIYLLNRTPTTQTPNSTPYSLWFGKKPSLNHIRTFGCEAYMLVPHQKRTKLEPKSKKLILVGYENNSENYRLFDVSTKKITVSRNVIFNENPTNQEQMIPYSLDEEQRQLYGENQQQRNAVDMDQRPLEQEEDRDGQLVDRPGTATGGEWPTDVEEEEEIPELRPRRQIKIPKRFNDYELYDINFIETDIPDTYEEAMR